MSREHAIDYVVLGLHPVLATDTLSGAVQHLIRAVSASLAINDHQSYLFITRGSSLVQFKLCSAGNIASVYLVCEHGNKSVTASHQEVARRSYGRRTRVIG